MTEAPRRFARGSRGVPAVGGGWIPWMSLAAGAIGWEFAVRLLGSDRLPPFSAVLERLAVMSWRGEILAPLAASLGSLVVGFLAAAVLGVLSGALMARSATLEHLVDIYFDALMAAPTLIYVPVLFALFGITRASQVALVFAYAFFIVAATTHDGIRAVDRRLVEMARAFGASERQVFWSVSLPAAKPFMLTALRLGAARAVKGMVVGEMVIALSGLGAALKGYGARFDVGAVLAILLVILLVSAASTALVGTLAHRLIVGNR